MLRALGAFSRAGGYPTVCAGIVSAAGVHIADAGAKAAPDDHFSAVHTDV